MTAARAWQLWLWDGVGARVVSIARGEPFGLAPDGVARVEITADARLELRAGRGAAVFVNDVQLTGAAELRPGDLVRVGGAQAVVLARSEGATARTRSSGADGWSRGTLSRRLDEELERAGFRRGNGPKVVYALVHGVAARSPAALESRLRELWPAWGRAQLGPQTFGALSLGGSADVSALAAVVREVPGTSVGWAAFGDDGFCTEGLREVALERLAGEAGARWPDDPVAVDPAMVRLAGWVDRAAVSHHPLIFEGEPGTGRLLWARRLALRNGRRASALRVIDCRRGVEQVVEALRDVTDGATVILTALDALGDEDANTVGERASAAAGAWLGTAATTPRVWMDRASVVPLPALRDRPADVLPLATRALEGARRWLGRRNLSFGPDAREALLARAWPGNVRELRNAVWLASLAAESDELRAENLPAGAEGGAEATDRDSDLRSTLRATEKDVLLAALARTRWNVSQTARELGLPRRTVVYRMGKLGLRRPA